MASTYEDSFQQYYESLKPLFMRDHVDTFEYACSILRVGGLQDAGWDALEESDALIQDLMGLQKVDFPADKFKDVEKTKWRLALLTYAHITEMDAPYLVLANLLRVRQNQRFIIAPFSDLIRKPSKRRLSTLAMLPSPSSKIKRIKELADKANMPIIGKLFDEFYFPVLRNGIDHSDYVLHDQKFRLCHGSMPEKDGSNLYSPSVPYERLNEIFSRTFAFYHAFFALETAERKSFQDQKNEAVQYDFHLKGLLEYLVDEKDLLCGFKLHWPNGLDSIYQRGVNGCNCTNLSWNDDGSVNFFVGEYFRNPSPFSLLVDSGKQPIYKPTSNGNVITWDTAVVPTRKVIE